MIRMKTKILIGFGVGYLLLLAIVLQAQRERSDLIIKLGGKFVNHWTQDAAASLGWQVNYFTGLPPEPNGEEYVGGII